MSITLKPVPGGSAIIQFPLTKSENREGMVGQMANQLSHLVDIHGSYVGRHMFIEASVAAIVRYAIKSDTLHDSRTGIEEAFDGELDRIGPALA